jgi:hypothetical protein
MSRRPSELTSVIREADKSSHELMRNTKGHGSVRLVQARSDDLLNPRARARARQVVPISELVFGALTQNRGSLEPCLGFGRDCRDRPHCGSCTIRYKPLKSRCGTQTVVARQAGRQCCAGSASRPQSQQRRYRRSTGHRSVVLGCLAFGPSTPCCRSSSACLVYQNYNSDCQIHGAGVSVPPAGSQGRVF